MTDDGTIEVGGLVFGNSFGLDFQYHEWTEFISDSEFCIRACVSYFLHLSSLMLN